MRNILVILMITGLAIPAIAQNDIAPTITLSGFADIFYVYDFNKPQTDYRQPFLFNHNRHNEFNINLALIQLSVDHDQFRGNIALQTGTYANDNYAAEPDMLKAIYEAYVGVALDKKRKLWLDAGVFSSHLGFESAISTDNWAFTRSLAAESSPFFLSGAKLSYEANEKWQFTGVVTNGWQRIKRVEGNSLLSFGTQVVFSPTENTSINWSTFIGTDDPDDTRRMRYFHNFYGQFMLSEKFGLIAGFDVGFQQVAKGSDTFDSWLVPTLIAHWTLTDQWSMAARWEYFDDQAGVIIPTGTVNGFQTTGLSWNVDYTPITNIVWRFEMRWFSSKDAVFEDSDGSVTESNFFIGTSLALRFEKEM